jgi:hypothetical protein
MAGQGALARRSRAWRSATLERWLARFSEISLDPESRGPPGESRFAYQPTYVFRTLKARNLRFAPTA